MKGLPMSADIFDSSMRSDGDLAGIFEYDGQTGYFYLYEVGGNECKKVVGAIRIVAESADFEEADVCVRWNASEDAVGLYIRGDLWALFDTIRHQKHGGDYRPGDRPSLPLDVVRRFDPS